MRLKTEISITGWRLKPFTEEQKKAIKEIADYFGCKKHPGKEEFRLVIYSDNQKYYEYREYLNQYKFKSIFSWQEVYTKRTFEISDFENAVAVKLVFTDYYHPYMYSEACNHLTTLCKKCYVQDFVEAPVLLENKGIIKKFRNRKTGATNSETENENIISVDLYNYLIGKGISKEYFRPIYSKRQEILAYLINGSNNILPEGSVYYAKWTSVCKYCGRMEFRDKVFDSTIIAHELENYNENVIMISNSVVDRLKGVFSTYEFDKSSSRITLIDMELFSYIREVCPQIVENSIPVLTC